MVRDRLSQVVTSRPLEPYADLRAVLTAAREDRIAEGWECEDIGPCVALCVGFLPQCTHCKAGMCARGCKAMSSLIGLRMKL